ncbi:MULTISPECIES: GDP-mannose 4,6-dehydratase [unclassified Prochlorococcus]|uniref:GDP-mannose 4,6-dehydratase n=1 Tax=unclassified Prochlorococcus TaxID=2627481 RepID=UPI00053391A3|nr:MULTISPECIES: GDP-mannose 4,6-dehydratase [unclassified Prochlorococcus]KGG16348.1 GDP-mannose 4,6-dehydratase [Prochlorococcus sp. MIT 0603]KGG17918.1 GDP-mannose 4,6-dehydratase [Prochlorococcus sp. MIT 0602]
MTILITGITGMVGSHLLDYVLENTDEQIIGLSRWRTSLENISNHIPLINQGKRIKLEHCDIRDAIGVDNIFSKYKFKYIFHLAAQSYPHVSFTNPIETYETNINGTEHILRSTLKYSPMAIVHVCSSSEVFGRVSKDKVPIDEETSFHPASPYAISKCGTDLIGRYYAEAFSLNTQITRMFTHTGPRRGDVFMESTFAKQIALIEKGYQEPIVKVGNLDSLRTIADVRDAVRAYWTLLNKSPEPGSYYNIGGNTTLKVGEILDNLIALSTNKSIKYKVDPDRLRPIDADLQVPNISKFVKKTNWSPSISYQQTIEDLLNYWRIKINKSGNTFLQR